MAVDGGLTWHLLGVLLSSCRPGVPVGSDEGLSLDAATAAAMTSLFDLKRGVEITAAPVCSWLRDVVSLD